MRINLASVFVDDQERARHFYTEVLGFLLKHDVPVGADRWLTVVSAQDPEGVELLLEPSGHRAVQPYKQALVEDGIPAISFAVDDITAEYRRLRELGVRFTQDPVDVGPVKVAVFDDTCGNLVQIAQHAQHAQ